jgi:hypothetical protein
VVIVVSTEVPSCSVFGSNYRAINVTYFGVPVLISLASISYSPDL